MQRFAFPLAALAAATLACGSAANDDVGGPGDVPSEPDASASGADAGARDGLAPDEPSDARASDDAPDATGIAVAQPAAVLAGATWQSLAVAADGSVVAWGCGASSVPAGQCAVPSGITGAVSVAAGSYHSVALTSTGALFAWGCKGSDNGVMHDEGQCNVPTTGKFVAIAAANVVTLAVKNDGTVVQLGPGSPPAGLDHVVAVAAGTFHDLALKDDGTVVAWGCYDAAAPECHPPAGLSGVVGIAAGTNASFALKSDGTVVAWGCGPNTGSTTLCTVPAGLDHVVSIRAFADEAIAVKSDGSVVVWYRYAQTYLAPPASVQNIATVGAAGEFVLGAKHDGSALAWGACFSYDVCKIPQGLVVLTK